jgi:hypothetical protein
VRKLAQDLELERPAERRWLNDMLQAAKKESEGIEEGYNNLLEWLKRHR